LKALPDKRFNCFHRDFSCPFELLPPIGFFPPAIKTLTSRFCYPVCPLFSQRQAFALCTARDSFIFLRSSFLLFLVSFSFHPTRRWAAVQAPSLFFPFSSDIRCACTSSVKVTTFSPRSTFPISPACACSQTCHPPFRDPFFVESSTQVDTLIVVWTFLFPQKLGLLSSGPTAQFSGSCVFDARSPDFMFVPPPTLFGERVL